MATRSTPGTLGVPPAAAVRGRVLCDSAHNGRMQSCRGFQSDRIFLLLALPGLRVGSGASPFGIGALDRNQESAIDLLQPMVPWCAEPFFQVLMWVGLSGYRRPTAESLP